MTFAVLEGDSPNGPFATVVSQTVSRTGTGTGTGAGFYSSNSMNVALTAGKFYIFTTGWDGDSVLYYFDNTPAPHSVSFGQQLGGFAADVYPLSSPIVAGLQPGNYHQRVTTSESWLSVSPASGFVAPGSSDAVSVIADSTGLAEGEYTGSLAVSTNDPTQPLVTIPVTMIVGVDSLSISPTTDFATIGLAGGPFAPPCSTYTLHNIGTSSLTWGGSCSETWVGVTPAGGSLPANTSLNAQVCTNGTAAGLPLGSYTANCSFENQTFGSSYTRAVRLQVTVCTDQDGDAYGSCSGDCDDTNPAVHPGVVEVCDGVDNDCDGAIDEDFGVGLGCVAGLGGCVRNGHIMCAADQHSTNCDAVQGSPAPESCNGADDDCDGQVDDGIYCDCVPFRDEFDEQLQPGWTWVRENPATWSLVGRPGWLAIDMEYGDLWQGTNNSRNTLLRPAPAGDFRMESLVEVDLRANINQAHILLYQTDNHYVRFGPVRSGGGLVLDMVHEVDGGIVSQVGRGISTNRLYLRIDRVGSTATLYYSGDGVTWNVHRVIADLQFNPTYVGVVAFDGSEPPSASMAWYDYFQVLPAASCNEVCNGVDDDLDGAVDEDPTGAPLTQSCYPGTSGTRDVGICHAGVQTCGSGAWGVCQGAVVPTAETCNGSDDDCDGVIDEELGQVRCGVGGCQRRIRACVDGVPQLCIPGEPSAESCNGLDDDCDGLVDEDFDLCTCNKHTYTTDEDFDQGRLVNVNHETPAHDQLQLNSTTSTFPFIWMAVSGRGTIVKVNTETGIILGEYQTAPDGRGRNPSRTTVDFNGNVWTGNRDERSGGRGSVVQLGLLENNQCVDRNGNGVIDTSNGLGDVRPWSNLGGIDDNGGVASAEDECVIHYVRVDGDGIRHVSVDANNNVWIGGSLSGSDNAFNLLDGSTGAILAGFNVGGGGYGGLVDRAGIIWSAGKAPGSPHVLLRYDTKKTTTTSDDTWRFIDSHQSYGLAVDCSGNIWNTQYDANRIAKFDPAGNLFPGFPKGTGGATYDRGVAVTSDCDIWVANSGGRDVSRLDNDGNVGAVIDLGDDGYGPTGVAVDAAGKVWVTCYSSNTAKRIDPRTNSVDLTVSLGANAYPYNYSDMTGQLARSVTSPRGTWTIVHDGRSPNAGWEAVSWDGSEPSGAQVTARARTAETIAGLGGASFVPASNGGNMTVPNGRYLEIEMTLTPGTNEAAAFCDWCDLLGTNLIANGGAEAGPGSIGGYDVIRPILGWFPNSNFTVVHYGAPQFPASTDPGPPVRGNNFFAGGPDTLSSSATQSVDISRLHGMIDEGRIEFQLSGYLGGFDRQNDNAVLTVTFRSVTGAALRASSIGPVTVADRNGATGLLFRSKVGHVPVGTRRLEMTLVMSRAAGSYDDGYADDLVLTLTNPGGAVSPVLSSVTVARAACSGPPCTPSGPTDEECNGIDDDCDGWVDEDYVPAATNCGVGACASAGVTSCINGQVVVSCDAGTATADTTCNGVDDDCDGAVDEDYAAVATTCGVGACASVGNTSCIGGQVHDSCLPGQPAPNDATCDGLDDDCDGVVDEDFVSTAVSCGIGACSSTGQTRCLRGQVVELCSPGVPSAEVCDGLDNDCDGPTDENLGTATCGVGACVRTVDNCVGGVPQGCVPGLPSVEVCNGVDDDCNGIVDDGGNALCDDSNGCTDDSCNPASGCLHTSNTNPCDDGNACTTGDQCAFGTCRPGTGTTCDDGNPCTVDSCDPATGCVNDAAAANGFACGSPSDTGCDNPDSCLNGACAPNYEALGFACSDGSACTTADACDGAGLCVGGPAPNCDDGNPCTVDSCDPNFGCRNVPNGVCEVSPRSQGFWRRLCAGPHPEGSITQADVECVNDSCTFASVHTLAELCDRLTPNPSNNKCEQAESQFMALMLNHCQNRLTDLALITSQCTSHTTVGPSRTEADALLCSGTRNQATCTLAQCESEELNSGSALLANSLRLSLLPDGSVRMTWDPPYGISDLGPPHAYVVRRRASGETAYEQLSSGPDLSYVDATAAGGGFYEYDVVPVW